MNSEVIAAVLVGGYLIASLLATFYVRGRGFTGKRLALLLILVWLVPFLGAGCASAAAWEWGKNMVGSDPIPDVWIAAGRSDSRGGADNGDGHH